MQNLFIKQLKAVIPENQSIIDEISAILNLSYDAAYRRVNNKTSLSLEEAVVLSKHFKISLNNLYEVGEQNTLLTEKSPPIKDFEGLNNYFKASLENILPLTKLKSASITYSAKDIPLFYTLTDSHLSRYKMYIWMKFLNEDGSLAKVSFDQFLNTIPQEVLDSAYQLSETYNYINITEFWNDSTINGSLHQIFYYFETGLLSKRLALLICKDLHDIVDHVEQQTINQTIINSKNNASYHLYESDLLSMTNTIMVKTQHQKVFFTPYTVLTYFKIQHGPTCDGMDQFFEKQRKNSKLLVRAGEKDRSLFFNKMRQKIERVEERVTISKDLGLF